MENKLSIKYYRSFYEISKELNQKQFYEFNIAVCGVLFYEKHIDNIQFKDNLLQMLWISIKHSIKASINGYCSKKNIDYDSLFATLNKGLSKGLSNKGKEQGIRDKGKEQRIIALPEYQKIYYNYAVFKYSKEFPICKIKCDSNSENDYEYWNSQNWLRKKKPMDIKKTIQTAVRKENTKLKDWTVKTNHKPTKAEIEAAARENFLKKGREIIDVKSRIS